ncbi:MAG TPA: hypothetical protein VEW07_06390 [Solirubrobacterales bacterium]|nr:hypothetical protein [Solirubrobacterales bacterium]
MAQAKAKAKKAAAPKKAAAAQAEKTTEANTFDFRGLTVKLPKKVPLSLAMKYRRMTRDRSGADLAFLDLIEGLVGADQYEAIERKIDAEGLTLDDDAEVLVELAEQAMGVLGMSPGE